MDKNPSTKASLLIKGPRKSIEFPLKKFPLFIGNGTKSDLYLDDPTIPDQCLRISKRGDLFILKNNAPTCVCFVNGDKVLSKLLRNGDAIVIGNYELVFTSQKRILISEDFGKTPFKYNPQNNPNSINLPIGQIEITSLLNIFPRKMSDAYKIFATIEQLSRATALIDIAQIICKKVMETLKNCYSCNLALSHSHNKELYLIHRQQIGDYQDTMDMEALCFRALSTKSIEYLSNNHILSLAIPILSVDQSVGCISIECPQIRKTSMIKKLSPAMRLIAASTPYLENKMLRKEVDDLILGVVESMVATIEAKDTYTVGHSERVCRYALAIGQELQLDKESMKNLMISALCHDIGKIGIPDQILKKATSLSHDEYEEMKLHPIIGANIISCLPHHDKFISGVKYHHEKWDGTGYPDGLTGEDIPFFGRIIAVADAFDAMVSGRSYSGFIEEDEAVQKIKREIDIFDPDIVTALTNAWENGRISRKNSTLDNM